jgi:hypothetical protein
MLGHKFVYGISKTSRAISDCMPDDDNSPENNNKGHESVNHRDSNKREQAFSYLEVP